jgi:chromosome segregation ATPase
MATRRANKRPELNLLKGPFQTIADTISTILKEKDEKIKDLEKTLQEKNWEFAEFELEHVDCEGSINALEKRCRALQQENHQLKDENGILRATASTNQSQYEKIKIQAEDLQTQLESRKRKWEVVKEVMEEDGSDRGPQPGCGGRK